MTAMVIVRPAEIRGTALPAAGQRAGAGSGDPQVGIRMLAPEAKGSTGIWDCTPGGRPVVNRADTAFTYTLSGRARLTDDATGAVTEIGPGDPVILPPG